MPTPETQKLINDIAALQERIRWSNLHWELVGRPRVEAAIKTLEDIAQGKRR